MSPRTAAKQSRAKQTAPQQPRRTITYFVTRDSIGGTLADKCGLWWVKPLRNVCGDRVTWLPSTSDKESSHLGDHPVDHVLYWFHVYPETDREMICSTQDVKVECAEPRG